MYILQLRGWLAEGVQIIKFGFVQIVRILPSNLHCRCHRSILDSELIKGQVNSLDHLKPRIVLESVSW